MLDRVDVHCGPSSVGGVGVGGELQERTEWFAVKAFGRRAEIADEYLHKGSRVYLEGRKRTESWEDKKTGGKNYRDLVYVDRIEFLDSRSNGNGRPEDC